MKKTSKLDELKFMVIVWNHTREISTAWAICEFLRDNLNINEEDFVSKEEENE